MMRQSWCDSEHKALSCLSVHVLYRLSSPIRQHHERPERHLFSGLPGRMHNWLSSDFVSVHQAKPERAPAGTVRRVVFRIITHAPYVDDDGVA